MVDGGTATFSVVYFDGETRTNVGDVTVDSSFNFNNFLSFLSHKIGISPHQFSVYLASFGSNRKIPITAKVDFAAIVRNTAAASSFFFVKRSKRPKKNKVRSNKASMEHDNINNHNPPSNIVLLRRNSAVPFTMSPVLKRIEYEKRMMDLTEQYLTTLRLGNLSFKRETPNAATGNGRVLICEECSPETDGGFQPCVFDKVTFNFRSLAGPVARPVKGTGYV